MNLVTAANFTKRDVPEWRRSGGSVRRPSNEIRAFSAHILIHVLEELPLYIHISPPFVLIEILDKTEHKAANQLVGLLVSHPAKAAKLSRRTSTQAPLHGSW